VRAGERSGLAPSAARIELPDQDQQFVGARIQARGQRGDRVAELLGA
jgi:hypothetical protein